MTYRLRHARGLRYAFSPTDEDERPTSVVPRQCMEEASGPFMHWRGLTNLLALVDAAARLTAIARDQGHRRFSVVELAQQPSLLLPDVARSSMSRRTRSTKRYGHAAVCAACHTGGSAMNDMALAYMLAYGHYIDIDGSPELVLPLERIQPFLDLIGPGDVLPDKLQTLYRMQAELVAALKV